ncbi:MAG: DoxX family protein [Bacteroidaceae bacterium]|jgi:putative oxidoreductase|nr:DoxX family protein [Bacteroidaceae bacterium]
MFRKKLLKSLFSEPVSSSTKSMILLLARLIFGFLFLSHGIAKLHIYSEYPETFPNPIGIGSRLSLWLVLFAEIICSFGFILGSLFRLCLIPMIFTMCIAFFVIHAGDPLATKELSFIYLTVFVLLYITGPGRYSVDGFLKRFL